LISLDPARLSLARLALLPELLLHRGRDRAYDAEGHVPELERRLHDVPRVHELAIFRIDAIKRRASSVGKWFALELDVPRHADGAAAAVGALVDDEEHVVGDAVARFLEQLAYRADALERGLES
jgi:hypothetical protein